MYKKLKDQNQHLKKLLTKLVNIKFKINENEKFSYENGI